jgi:hypothetical protein
MHPHWLGSPQHVAAGFVAAAFLMAIAPRLTVPNRLLGLVLAIGLTMTAEAVIELFEYPLLYSDSDAVQTPVYYDTIADLAATFAGALLGALGGLALWREPPRKRP